MIVRHSDNTAPAISSPSLAAASLTRGVLLEFVRIRERVLVAS